MKYFFMVAITLLAFNFNGFSYPGKHHSSSHGGHYSGGRGSSHKGGHYKNSRTNNHYGKHKH